MHISLIVAHPNTALSLNHAIAHIALETLQGLGHTVAFHDLYHEQFAPVYPRDEVDALHTNDALVAQHQQEIRQADGIIIVHPNWWGQPPAILKGWIDRVLALGVAYDFPPGDSGSGLPTPLLKVQQALVLSTSNTPWERERDLIGNPLAILWQTCVFGFCSVANVEQHTFSVVADSTPEQRAAWLDDTRARVVRLFPAQ